MFKLESNRLKREFKIQNETFYASKILNKYSDMTFVPDGNGSEFVVVFADGDSFSSKGLPVVLCSEENDKLQFVFAENKGVTVVLEYWVHSDQNTICKQITLIQSDDRVIDFVLLESIGIVNSQTHLGVERMDGSDVPCEWACLGQPFYVDSLFFGSEFPGTDNRIIYGTGRIKYYVGRSVGRNFVCPVTVMGAGADNTAQEMKKAFNEYLDSVRLDIQPYDTYNTWFDKLDKITPDSVARTFSAIAEKVKQYDLPLDSFVLDDGWSSCKKGFWSCNKAFAGRMNELSELCEQNGAQLGLWLSPRGGYSNKKIHKYAKKLEKEGNGYLSATNTTCTELCCASKKYSEKLAAFIISAANDWRLSCLKLDGFAKEPCFDGRHDHLTGGKYNMYYVTEQWHNWVEALKAIRADEAGSRLWINMTSYVNPSPWWLQWVNSVWLQNSDDIGFAKNLDSQPAAEAEITYRDARYFDQFVTRTTQLPLYAVFNHEPINAKCAGLTYTDDEFEKALLWNAVRGQAISEMYLSPESMTEQNWQSLKKYADFRRENYSILKNACFIGGNPEENNIYGYISWSSEGEGIIALRNPTDEETGLTLTLNRLMNAPETLADAAPEWILGTAPEGGQEHYGYNDKLDITLQPFEAMILKLK